MYREIVSAKLRYLDEDLKDIEAVHQQLRALQRLVAKLQMSSKHGQRWQQEMQDSIDDVLHDTSTEWLIEQGNDLLSQREPF
jgi:flagellar motility protein MotE (MotC chaperone)